MPLQDAWVMQSAHVLILEARVQLLFSEMYKLTRV